MGMTDGTIQKAVYQYNGLGHRMGQNIATGDAAPARTIQQPGLFLGWQCRRNGIGRSEETYAIFDGKHFKEVKGK